MMNYHRHIELAGTVTVGPKGQVVIPCDVRDRMGIHPGDKLVALYIDDRKSIAFITESQAQEHIEKMGEQFTNFERTSPSKESTDDAS